MMMAFKAQQLSLTLEGGYVRSCLFCESGGTGRRARLRISWATVGVQIPPLAPFSQHLMHNPNTDI